MGGAARHKEQENWETYTAARVFFHKYAPLKYVKDVFVFVWLSVCLICDARLTIHTIYD